MRFVLTGFIQAADSFLKIWQAAVKFLFLPLHWGWGTDYLIQRYSRLQMSRAVILQAAAAAMIEEYCDRVCRELKAAYEAKGLYLRPRFSPGYWGFSSGMPAVSFRVRGWGKAAGNPSYGRVSDDAVQICDSGDGACKDALRLSQIWTASSDTLP